MMPSMMGVVYIYNGQKLDRKALANNSSLFAWNVEGIINLLNLG